MNNFNEEFNNYEENNDINFDIIKNIKTIGEMYYKKRIMINNILNKERSKTNLQNNLMNIIKNFFNKIKDIKTHIDLPINFKHAIYKNFTKNPKYKYLYNIECFSEKKNNLKIINNKFENSLKSNQIHDNNYYNINDHNNYNINDYNIYNINDHNFNINEHNLNNNNNFNNNIININNNNYNNNNNHNKDYYKEIENSIFNQKELDEKIIFQKKNYNNKNNLKQKYLGKKRSNESIIENNNLEASKIYKLENKDNKIYVHNTTINIYNNIINNENQNDIIKNEDNEIINNNESLVQYIGGKIRIKNINEDENNENNNFNNDDDIDEKLILDIKKIIIEMGKKYSKEQSKTLKKYIFELNDYKFEIIINKEINKISNINIKNHKNILIKKIDNYSEIIEFLKKIKMELGNYKKN